MKKIKKTPVKKPLFYTYNQNNSGGSFAFDKDAGISHFVIIEAKNPKEADERAEKIGLYFNGCDSGIDCDCCGDRWSSKTEYAFEKGTNKPTIYEENVSNGVYTSDNSLRWIDGPEGYIHYINGTIQPVRQVKPKVVKKAAKKSTSKKKGK